jgi:hypothetical protein
MNGTYEKKSKMMRTLAIHELIFVVEVAYVHWLYPKRLLSRHFELHHLVVDLDHD